jgi:hypothetical protein
MQAHPQEPPAEELIEIDLRDRPLAAALAWLIPGAGHAYQRRWGKAAVFAICILGTFFYGMYLGDGRVVYASWGPTEHQRRLPYFLQLGVGLPALPALVQASFDPPPLGDFMRPPRFHRVADDAGRVHNDELAMWNLTIHEFELGTVFTMIAGLLNVLAIYDAWGGPLVVPLRPRREPGEPPDGLGEGRAAVPAGSPTAPSSG